MRPAMWGVFDMRILAWTAVAGMTLFGMPAGRADTFVATNTTWRYRPGTNEVSSPTSLWRTNTYSDASWPTAPTPFFYGNLSASLTNGGTRLNSMSNSYTCVFLRKQFSVTDAASVTSMTLRVAFDDGFIAWLNGTELVRTNMNAGEPLYTWGASTSVTTPSYRNFGIANPATRLRTGDNYLCIQAFNRRANNSDFYINAELTALLGSGAPTLSFISPAPGSVLETLTNITVRFSEPVTGVNASDLLVGGAPAVSVSGSTTQYVFTVNTPPEGVVTVSWASGHGIADTLGTPFDHTAPDASWTYSIDAGPPTIVAVSPSPGSTLPGLTNITVTFSEPVFGVDRGDLFVNGQTALGVTGSASQYVFTVGSPAVGVAAIVWDVAHGITDGCIPPNSFDGNAPGAVWSYQIVDTTAPTVKSRHPPEGVLVRQLAQTEIVFSEPVTGVDASDLKVNGSPASGVQGALAGPYVFSFDGPATGTVIFGWATGHGIADLAVPANAFAGSSWTVGYDPAAPAPNIRINEFLASNQSTNGLLDEDGELEDWIELYNAGAEAVDLNGWSLSDDADEPGRWVFPTRLLNPGTYLVVYASGKDRRPTAPGSKLHTNFRLGSDGEYLGLWNADAPRRIVSEFAPEYPEQRNDISYGPDLAMQMAYFAVPTPGGPNTGATLTGIVPRVHFNVNRGFFRDPFDLILTVPMPGASIRYTTNGAPPTSTGGIAYTGAIRIARTSVIRAGAFLAGHLPSSVGTCTYVFPADVIQQSAFPPGWPADWGTYLSATVKADYEMDPEIVFDPAYSGEMESALLQVPTLSIVTHPDSLWAADGIYYGGNPYNEGLAWERAASCEWIQPDGRREFQVDAGLRIQGGEGRNPTKSPKHSFRLLFKGDYGPGELEFPLFPGRPVETYDTIILRAGFNNSWVHWDATQRAQSEYLRDQWARQTQWAMGHVSAGGRFAHVYLNGLYWGVYDVSDRPDADFAASYLGGEKEDWDVLNSAVAVDGDTAAWSTLQTLANAGVASNAQYEAIQEYVNVVNLADYMLLNHYAGNADWDHHNWYAARRRGTNDGYRFFCWDSERILESVTDLTAFSDNNANMPSRVYQKLRDNAEFRLLFADRIQRHCYNGGALSPESAAARFSALVQGMQSAIVAESARWGDYRRDVAPSGTADLYDRDYYWWPECNDILTAYLPARRDRVVTNYMTLNLYPRVPAPVFNQVGGAAPKGFLLTMSAGTNPIYYTTNGVDPRVYGTGATSPYARVYSGPVELNESQTIKARAWSNSVWSALTEARFQVQDLGWPLRISEVMYNPPGGDAYEFIELRNTSTAPLNVGLVHFKEVQFAFAPDTVLTPGQMVVVANGLNPAAFAARYPGVPVAGHFTGNLPNGGGRITLLDPQEGIIESVDYDDEDGWSREADGRGRSLERLDLEADPDDPANWTTAGPVYGTPGQPVSPPAAPPVRLNEAMADPVAFTNAHGQITDWIELYNPGAATVSLAGWSLSDGTDPRRYVFPAGTAISNGGFLVVWCDTATNQPGLHTGFGLSRQGESIALYDATTSRLDSVSFGLQAADFTVGRLAGPDEPWNLCVPTPGAPNTAATLAAATNLTLNEWFANPVSGEDDWLEIHNRDAMHPAALQDCYVQVEDRLYRIGALSFVPAGGFLRFWADETPGADHLDLKLPAAGGTLALYDALAAEVDRVTYTAQVEGVSSGRLPDGAATLLDFPGTASPGASNWVSTYTGPLLNEVLARNQSAVTNGAGRIADFVELRNPSAAPAIMDGMSLSIGKAEPGQWVFPAGTTNPGNGYLVLWCDGGRPATTNASDVLNTGRSLSGEEGSVHLFNAGGQEVDSVVYGFQIEDLSVGRIGGAWYLLDHPTAGDANAAAAALTVGSLLRINEWMADGGDDWFEIHNAGALPVSLTGMAVADTPALFALTNNVIGPLSFVGAGGWVLFAADGDRDAGGDHVGFQLNAMGESLRLYDAGGGLVDAAEFGVQAPGVSEGLLPDGAAARVFFPTTATPDASNYLPLTNVVVNEVLAHTDPPLEDAIEVANVSGAPVGIGGWTLSDDPRRPGKYTIPAGLTLGANGHAVFYEYQFNGGPGSAIPFNLNSFEGDTVLLSEVDGGGQPTGYRSLVRFGPSFNGMSFGWHPTTHGPDFVGLVARTFGRDTPFDLSDFRSGGGLTNAPARVPPVVINEIMYRSTNWFDAGAGIPEEYIELHNRTGEAVSLFDPAYPTNRWKLGEAVSFDLPGGVTVPSNGYALVVNFDPASNATAVAAFRARYGVPQSTPVYGPFGGRLADEGERIGWLAPDTPEQDGPEEGLVPYVLLEGIAYSNDAPWPAAAAGGGASLQRVVAAVYGNESTNWCAWAPSPGRKNLLAGTPNDYDGDGLTNGWESAYALNPEDPLDADIDSDGDRFTNRQEYLAGTDPRDPNSYLRVQQVTAQAGARLVQFLAVAGRTYSVLWCDDLCAADWQKLQDVGAEAVDRLVSIVDAAPVPRRFYRLVTPAQP